MLIRRRGLLASTAALIAARNAFGKSAFIGGLIPPNNAAFRTPQVHISAGQSWRGNCYSTMGTNGFNPQTQTLLTPAISTVAVPSGVMPAGAGVYIPPGLQNKLTGYTSAMLFNYPSPASAEDVGSALTIGRTAVLSQQLLRWANGVKTLTPIIEYNMSYPSSSWVSGGGGGLGPTTATFTGAMSGTTLTITNIVGTVTTGQVISGAGVTGQSTGLAANTEITAFVSGTGGNGTYTINNSQTVGAEAMAATSQCWTNMALINAAIIAALPDSVLRLNAATFRSVGWTQGGSFDLSSPTPTITEWTAMEAAYDALALPGTGTHPLLFYLGIRAPISTDTACTNAEIGSWQFVRANANGRTIGTSPWYQWPFVGTDTIHTGDYGTQRNGEFEGLAKYITEDEGTLFKPLWRSLTGNITVSGQTVTVPFDRPVGSFFATSPMAWMSDANDGIKVWPQNGFHVKRGGVDLTVTPTISGTNVVLTIAETLSVGNVLEVSYAFYGPGGPSPGPCSGVGGNLMMAGPSSLLFPGKTINSWAWPFLETVTV